MKWMHKSKRIFAILLILGLVCLPMLTIKCYAGIKDATVFQDVTWHYQGETGIFSDSGWLQSMCSTPNYIICLENSSNKESTPDTLMAFYRNDTDENGNPVQKYSLAKTMTEMDYEHGNGMTYNPNTNEILIVGSTPLNEANRGLVYIVDADTLKFKRSVRLTSTYKLLGIAYYEDQNCYIVQYFNDGYTDSFFVKVDADTFAQVGDIIPVKMWNNIRHQDFCISGDYLISLAFTNNVSNSNVMHIYDLTTGSFMAGYALNINGSGGFIEPESICELSPGEIMIGNALKNPRRIAFYSTTVAAAFKLTTSVKNGEISGSQKTVDYGSNYTVNYEPYPDYEIESITVDGESLNPTKYPESYVFDSISKNHTIDVKFKEKPIFTITTSVENGFVDVTLNKHRDNDVQITYGANEHYELSEVLVDGAPVTLDDHQTSYTFTNIQEAHKIDVKFKKIPSFNIETEVVGGTITNGSDTVYRNDDFTVYYEEKNEDYALGWIEVDGKVIMADSIRSQWHKYTFENVWFPHKIKVVYYWKYMPMLLIIGIPGILTGLVSIALLSAGYRHRRKMLKRYKQRRKEKERLKAGLPAKDPAKSKNKQKSFKQIKREKRAKKNHRKYAKKAMKNRAKAEKRVKEKMANEKLFENDDE
jgi:hypothetical protein